MKELKSPVPESEIPEIPEYIPNRDIIIRRHKFLLEGVESSPFNKSSIERALKYYKKGEVLYHLKKGIMENVEPLKEEAEKDECGLSEHIKENAKKTEGLLVLLKEKGLEVYMGKIED